MLRRNRSDKDVTQEQMFHAIDMAHRQMVIEHPALDGGYEVEVRPAQNSFHEPQVVYKFTINTGIQRVHSLKIPLHTALLITEKKDMHRYLEGKFYDAWGEDLAEEARTTNRFGWLNKTRGGNLYD